MCIAYRQFSLTIVLAFGLVAPGALAPAAHAEPRGQDLNSWEGRNFGLSDYENDNWVPLKGPNTVYHCSGYGCRRMGEFSFTDRDIVELAVIMSEALVSDTPQSERDAIARSIAWMEVRVGRALGTQRDKASIGFWAAGRKGQQDCVDEARNTAAYLAVLRANGLIRHHGPASVVSRGNVWRGMMPHYGVVMKELGGRRAWAVDSGVGRNGVLPRIEGVGRWYARGRSRPPAGLLR